MLEDDLTCRNQTALNRCRSLIEWYESNARNARLLYRGFQSAALILSALTPVLILWTQLPTALQALPAAIAAIATGLSNMFAWRENWLRFQTAAEFLKSERTRFETRTTAEYRHDLSAQQALENFVNRIEGITLGETGQWHNRARATGTHTPESSQG